MSNVLIFSTKWVEDNPQHPRKTIFYEKKKCNNHPYSDEVFQRATIKQFLCYDKSTVIADMFGVDKDDDGIELLVSIANKLVETNYGNLKNLSEDIANRSWSYLLQDIYNSLKENWSDARFINILSSFIPDTTIPTCYVRNDNDSRFSAIGISQLPYKTAGEDFCEEWSHALVKDFSEDGDDVILALHGSTDWKDLEKTGYGPMPSFSKRLSSELGRNVKVYVFLHEDFDDIAKALKMYNNRVSSVWTTIEQIWQKKVY